MKHGDDLTEDELVRLSKLEKAEKGVNQKVFKNFNHTQASNKRSELQLKKYNDLVTEHLKQHYLIENNCFSKSKRNSPKPEHYLNSMLDHEQQRSHSFKPFSKNANQSHYKTTENLNIQVQDERACRDYQDY